MNRTATLIMLAIACAAGTALAFQSAGQEIVTQGEVVAVSSDERTITVEEAPEPATKSPPDAMQTGIRRSFEINDATKLTSASGEAIALADIGVGSQATIHYVMDGGKNVALSIEVRSPATE